MLRISVGQGWPWEHRAKPGGPVKGEWTSLVTFDLGPYFKSTVFFKMFKNDLCPIKLL